MTFWNFVKGIILTNEADRTKSLQLEVSNSASTNTKTTILASQSADRTVTLPNATDTLVGRNTTDTLTNKTLTSPVISGATGITKADVGLSNVDNTSDAAKNAAVATLTNKTLTAPVINSPTGLTKADVGLANVDNTSDATKNAAIATLTNKTLTAPVINNPTGLVKADVGLANVDNTSDATKNSASATLTNKTIDAASNTITNLTNTSISASAAIARTKLASGTASHVVVNDGSGVLSSEATLAKVRGGTGADNTNVTFPSNGVLVTEAGAQTLTSKTLTAPIISTISNTGTVTLPTATDTLVARATTDTLTNKTISGASNTITNVSLTTGVTGTLPILNGGTGQTTANAALNALLPTQTGNINRYLRTNGTTTSWATVASGNKNYLGTVNGVDNGGSFENNTVGSWVLGNATLTNAFPSGVPTFGSGAAAQLSATITSTNPLAGSFSLQYASSVATTAGNFLSSPAFTIDREDRAKVLSFTFNYEVVSGTVNMSGTSANSFGVAIYDVTNAAWIQPAGVYNLVQSSGPGLASGTFQTPSNGSVFRFVLYNATATSGAVSLNVDDFYVGTPALVTGPSMSDWVAYTPTITAFGTPSSVNFYSRRVGDSLEVMGKFTTGTTTAVPNSITLGFNGVNGNVTIDSAKLPGGNLVGIAGQSGAAATFFAFGVIGNAGANTVQITQQTSTVGIVTGSQNGSALTGTGQTIEVAFTVPISGWSSNSLQSADTDTRLVAASYYWSTSGAYTSTTAMLFDVRNHDTHSAYNAGTGIYTIPVSGLYETKLMTLSSATSGSSLYTMKNGSIAGYHGTILGLGTVQGGGVVQFQANAGDQITFGVNGSFTRTGGAGLTVFDIKRLSGPATITATESVNVSAISTNTTAIPAIGSPATLTYTSKDYDSHNALNAATGVFTAPVSGKFRITAQYSNVSTAVNSYYIRIIRNGSVALESNSLRLVALSCYAIPQINRTLQLNAGDTVSIAFGADSAGQSLSGVFNHQFLNIERVGN